MPKAYAIFTEAITDHAGMGEYGRAAFPTLMSHGARVLAVDNSPEVLEGAWHGSQTVLLEFDSVEAARAWYDSQEYGTAKLLRQAAATTNAAILHGLE
jgi:uncharacterized protein (DUF1330 family)